jgi:hypothetical protein
VSSATERLGRYLNDHLAGSVAALELLDHLIGSERPEPTARTLSELRDDIEEDQATLRDLLRRIGVAESLPRKAAAWLTEKAGRLKLRLSGTADNSLELLEALEALSLGIEGKRGLWHALAALPAFAGVDFDRLQYRAIQQHNRVEVERLAAAHRTFRGTQ